LRAKHQQLALIVCLLFITSVFQCCKKSVPTTPDLPTQEQKGSIQVNSTPIGAQVYLDGNDTEKTTNCTLTDLSPGNHTVKLTKEGYEDYEQTVNVTAGQTVTVNATLNSHTITIISPPKGMLCVAGDSILINWTTSSSSSLLYNSGASDGKVGILIVTNVKIELYEDGNFKKVIASEALNDGDYIWKIPKDIGGGKNYKIRISVLSEPNIYGESKNFKIYYNVEGTYKGNAEGTHAGQYFYVGITWTQNQNGKNTSGTWFTTDGTSGTSEGTISKNKINITVTITKSHNTYTGNIEIQNNGDKLEGCFSGWTNYGYLNMEFTVYRE